VALSVAALAALALAGGARAQTESACKGKLKKACRQDDACVHAGKGLCLDAIDPCNGIQAKKNGQTRKAQCEAKTGIDDRKCKCTKPNKKKCGVCETTGISGDGKAFLKDNLMVISGGGLTYKPHKKDGDWTPLCSVTGQAVEMSKVDLGKDGGPAAAKQIWDSNAAFNKPNLPGKYFEHTRKDNKGELYFMDKFFQTAVIGAGPGGCGTDDDSAREQITKKTTQDWVAVTHIMAALDLAEDELVKHPEKPHKAHPYYDRVAALYFGCGDTNPIPLREGVTWGDMAPKDASKNTDPFGPSKYAVSGRADMRAKNYGTLVVVPTPAGVQRETAAVNVQVLNALKMEPSLLGIAEIRDAIYTIYSQATLRYTSKMSLDARPASAATAAPARASPRTPPPRTLRRSPSWRAWPSSSPSAAPWPTATPSSTTAASTRRPRRGTPSALKRSTRCCRGTTPGTGPSSSPPGTSTPAPSARPRARTPSPAASATRRPAWTCS
jgi:hypothetical protein